MSTQSWAFLLTSCVLLPIASARQTELSPQQQQWRKEAIALTKEGGTLFQQRKLPEANTQFNKALELMRKVYTPEQFPQGHAELAATLDNLARLHELQRENEKAEPMFREVLRMRQRLYPEDRFPKGHPLLARSLHNLGSFLMNRADVAAAEPLLRQGLRMRQQLYSEGHLDLAHSLSSLGELFQRRGEYTKAVPFAEQSLAVYQKLYPASAFPQGHADVATALNNLGVLRQYQAELDKAEDAYRQALRMRQQLYPKERYPSGQPDLVGSLLSLGGLLKDRADFLNAESLLLQGLDMCRQLYPKEQYPRGHPQFAYSLYNLALLYKAQGELARAEPLYRQALEMRQQLFPKELFPRGHPDLVLSINGLGSLLAAQGEYGKAEPYFIQTVQMYRLLFPVERFPDGHPNLAAVLHNLAAVLALQGKYEVAARLDRQALEMRQRLFPKNRFPRGHPELGHSLASVGGSLRKQGENAKAEAVLREALEMRQQLYPTDSYPHGHPELAHSLNDLALVLGTLGEADRAERLFQQALQMRRQLFPGDRFPDGNRDVAQSLHNMGFFLYSRQEYARAETLLREALQIHTRLATRLAEVAPEAVALNAAADFPLTRDGFLSAAGQLPGAAARSYEAVWHSRAALTRVYQRRHLALIAAASDPEVRKDWERLQGLRRQREGLIRAPAPPPAQQKPRDATLAKLARDIDQLDAELVTRLPPLKHAQELARRGPDTLRDLLPRDAVVIDYLYHLHFEPNRQVPGKPNDTPTAHYLAFVLSRDGVQRIDLGKADDIDAAVRNWRQTITTRLPVANEAARSEHEKKLSEQGALVRRLVWTPVEKQLPTGTATLYLVPDALLTQVPWAALPGQGKDNVLLDDYALAVLPHSPFLLEQLTPPPPRFAKRPQAPTGILIVGDVEYDERPLLAAASRGSEEVVAHKVVWNSLKGTAVERELLARVLARTGPKVTASLTGVEAGTSRLRQELERARFAHLSTHGFFADKELRSLLQFDPKHFTRTELESGGVRNRVGEAARNPLVLSGLVCSGANRADTPERGILSGDAIAGLLLDDLHLAVLSACDTGLGDVAGGEGVFGLQRAFHLAGCKNVVASLWKVDDAATAALMVRFYGYLFAEGKDKPLPAIEALRRAQLDLYRHPELIPAWSKGELRAPGKPRPASTPAPADTPRELVTPEGRAPIRLWAAFTLSGLGR